jgi:hypothetical protein
MRLCIVRVLLTDFQQIVVQTNLPEFRLGFQFPRNVSGNALELKVHVSIVPHRRNRIASLFVR